MLENLKPAHKSYVQPCFVITRVAEHPGTTEADLEAVRGYLADKEKWPAKTLAKALTSQGIFITDKSVIRHREGRCNC